MPDYTLYKLRFTTPLHIGNKRDDYGISLRSIQSDTMYAALTSCLAKRGEKIAEDGYLGFTITSLFPYFQDGDKTRLFFPKPKTFKMPMLKNAENIKRVKKVEWIEQEYFERLINGEEIITDNNIGDIHGVFLTKAKEEKEFITSRVYPHVSISRGEDEGSYYYMDRIFFAEGCGLYFLSEGDDKLLDKAMELLQYEGIGTDRNTGNGAFEYEKKSIRIDVPGDAEMSLCLSVFIPESESMLISMTEGERAAYDIARRGGWITTAPYNTIRKKAVYAFLPGSVFNGQRENHTGAICNLNPNDDTESFAKIEHPIWRNGKSIFIPIKI